MGRPRIYTDEERRIKNLESMKKYDSRPEIRERENKLQQRPKEIQRIQNWYFKSNYNIDTDDYNQKYINQDGCCFYCRRHQSEFKCLLSVDHDHKCCSGPKSCGKCVRHLLCHSCNKILATVENHIELVKKMLEEIK